MKVHALVLSGYGLNCEFETAHVLTLAGAKVNLIHISKLLNINIKDLNKYHLLVFSGGFSWGDDHGAGVLLANSLKNHLIEKIKSFLQHGGLIIGICNGFQILVNLGLLPLFNNLFERKIALTTNNCGNFQNRWVKLLIEKKNPCLFTKNLTKLELPIRHGEGNFTAELDVIKRIEEMGLIVIRYGDKKGKLANLHWPENPNGSIKDIAGICDPSGRIFGLMPHPEGYYRLSQHPDWTLIKEQKLRQGIILDPLSPGPGLTIFTNAIKAITKEL